jgi:cell division inhibitor SulA/protein ImuA
MSREERLQDLLNSHRVWRSAQLPKGLRCVPTGFAELDQHLGGGWPTGVLTEFLLASPGIGELQLLLPALCRLSSHECVGEAAVTAAPGTTGNGLIGLVAPPHIPYAPALVHHGLDVSCIVLVDTTSTVDALWAMEQLSRSALCVAVLGWVGATRQQELRRLQLAAEAGGIWCSVFRHTRFQTAASPAALRIRLRAVQDELGVDILRNRYGSPGSLLLRPLPAVPRL